MKEINHVRDLQDKMIALFEALETEEISLAQAKEMNNTSGKILKCSKIELDYNKVMERKKVIPFIEKASEDDEE